MNARGGRGHAGRGAGRGGRNGNGQGRGYGRGNNNNHNGNVNGANGMAAGNAGNNSGFLFGTVILKPGVAGNFELWLEMHYINSRRKYRNLGLLFKTNQYYSPPAITLGVNYDEDDLEDPVRFEMLKAEIKKNIDEIREMEMNRSALYMDMWSTMSADSREKVKMNALWAQIEPSENDPLLLLQAIRATHAVAATGTMELDQAIARDRYYNLLMQSSESLVKLKERFDYALRALTAVNEPLPSPASQAIDFINRLDNTRYAGFKANLQNNRTSGIGQYPTSLADAFTQASRYVVVINNNFGANNNNHHNVFVASAERLRNDRKRNKGNSNGGSEAKDGKSGDGKKSDGRNGNNNSDKSNGNKKSNHVKFGSVNSIDGKKSGSNRLCCLICDAIDHFAKDCPKLQIARSAVSGSNHTAATTVHDASGGEIYDMTGSDSYGNGIDESFALTTLVMNQTVSNSKLNSFYVLLDNQASKSVFHEKRLVYDLREGDYEITISGIGGSQTTSLIGNVPYFGVVSVLANGGLANILSLREVEDMYTVEYIQSVAFIVHVNDSVSFRFERMENGLYGCDMRRLASMIKNNALCVDYALVQTVSANESLYTKREVQSARLARQLKENLGFPSDGKLVQLINQGGLVNSPVTAQDVYRASKIYGPHIAELKGKLKKKSSEIVKIEHIPKPVFVDQVLHCDLMFIDRFPYLVTVVVPLGLKMVCYLNGSREVAAIRKALNIQLKDLKAHGFSAKAVLADGEGGIHAIKDELKAQGIQFNPASAGQHVPVAEAAIKEIKEKFRSVYHSLPYRLAAKFFVFLVLFCVARINILPSSLRQDSMSPTEMFTGRKVDFKKHVRIGFGQYVQLEDPAVVKNSIAPRTEGAISLYPIGNVQGSMKFYVLSRDSLVVRDRWVALPIPQAVIDVMNASAAKDKNHSHDPTFHYSSFKILLEDGYVVSNGDVPLHPLSPAIKFTGDNVVDVGKVPDILVSPLSSSNTLVNADSSLPVVQSNHRSGNTAASIPSVLPTTAVVTSNNSSSGNNNNNVQEDTAANNVITGVVGNSNSAALSANRPNTRYGGSKTPQTAFFARTEFNFHISLKVALRKFKGKALIATLEELQQMIDKNVWEVVNWKSLSPLEKKSAIRSFLFLKEKFDSQGGFEKLKARLVAGGNFQVKMAGDDISSPTVFLSSVFMIGAIAAKERRTVVTVDIAGAYLNANIVSKDIYMKIDPLLSDMLVNLDGNYERFRCEDGALVVKLKKALYGCIESAKLWYDHLARVLGEYGFVKNPKDNCVFNRTGKSGKQMTVCIYVDDLLITCAENSDINEFVIHLKKEFETVKVNEGNVFSYLGMTMDFSHDGKLVVSMDRYESDMLSSYGVERYAMTPATNNLFDVRDVGFLEEDRADEFHSRVAKLLYLAKRTRPDILTAVAFLSTRIQCPTEDDWKKLERVFKYLNKEKNKPIVLEVDDDMSPKSYVDASYGVHSDAKSHSGVYITLGGGPVFVKSVKQKLVSKSSTEAELIALSDAVGQVVWTRDFLLLQGYEVGPATIYQDNQSTMMLVDKGKSNAPGTRHINIRYFFVKDRVKSGEVKVLYLSTDKMISDYFTKSKQGTVFKDMVKVIHNIDH